MLGSILGVLGTVFGVNGAQNAVTKVGGIVTNAAAIPALIYLTTHAGQQINLGTTSLGFLAIIVGFAWVIVEVLRRN